MPPVYVDIYGSVPLLGAPVIEPPGHSGRKVSSYIQGAVPSRLFAEGRGQTSLHRGGFSPANFWPSGRWTASGRRRCQPGISKGQDASERGARGRASERASEGASARAGERASERGSEVASERVSERAIEGEGERASEREGQAKTEMAIAQRPRCPQI